MAGWSSTSARSALLVPLDRGASRGAAGPRPRATCSPARPASARSLRRAGLRVHSNDLATYSEALGQAYIAADETLDRARIRALLAELGRARPVHGYFTETFCVPVALLPAGERGAGRRDPRRDRPARRLAGRARPPADEPARGGRPGRLDLRPADGLRQAVGAALVQRRSSCASRPRSPGPAGTVSPAATRSALAAAARRDRLRLPRPALQPALLLLELPRLGDAGPLGRARALRRRLQARSTAGRRRAPSTASATAWRRSASLDRARCRRRGSSSRSATRASTTLADVARAAGGEGPRALAWRSTSSATSARRSGSTTRAASRSARVSHLRNTEVLFVVGPDEAAVEAAVAAAAGWRRPRGLGCRA